MADYTYASSKIRALEPAILDATDIERMVDAGDFESAFRVLNDTDYADNLLDVEPLNYRDALDADYVQLYDLLKNITPDKNLFKLLFAERDFVNIKFLFKAKYFELDVDDKLKTPAVYDPARLKAYILDDKDLGLDTGIKKTISEIKKILGQEAKPDEIDSAVTQMYFAYTTTLANQLDNKFVSDLIKIRIDNANMKIWLRAKRLNLEKDKMASKLIVGGDLRINKLKDQFNDDLKNLRPVVAAFYDKAVVEAYDQYAEKDNLFELEKALADYLISFIKRAKLISHGPEVIMAYYLAKENALTNIRVIMTGKLNNINSEEIKKTLRQAY